MSLYHETAAILTGPSTHGGSLKSRIFGNKDLKSPPAQVYALAFESSKWSAILKEVVENSQLLLQERKLTPALSILLVHDFLLAKKGIALPASHGLRVAIERHKARLQAEFTRARVRRKCSTVEALRAAVEAQLGPPHPRWIRVNTLKSTIDDQLDTTFKGYEVVATVGEVMESASTGKKVICLDATIPNLIAAPPGIDFTKTEAYKAGAIILQDKASCFPAYLLDPRPEHGDIIDACSAPGNKTTHLAGILYERGFAEGQRILAFEKDKERAKTLEKMVHKAGCDKVTVIHPGADFLKTDPDAPEFRSVGALLLDPSCSGSGIVGRDDTPEFHLPSSSGGGGSSNSSSNRNHASDNDANPKSLKRKRESLSTQTVLVDDDGKETVVSSEQALQARLEALASFQLKILLHAFAFPAATRVTYSTCSTHATENERVVAAALRSDIARERGWRILRRDEQPRGMREWPVRGDPAALPPNLDENNETGDRQPAGGAGREALAEACVRADRDDGRGVMGFFVAAFVRDVKRDEDEDEDGPYVRDAQGRIIRDEHGIPTLKKTGKKVIEVIKEVKGPGVEIRFATGEPDDGDGPFERDANGRIIRDENGMPTLKGGRKVVIDYGEDDEDEEESGYDEDVPEEDGDEEGEEDEYGDDEGDEEDEEDEDDSEEEEEDEYGEDEGDEGSEGEEESDDEWGGLED
ncbi:hypothetical protein VTH82DRAFT_967 [Thermothelomyces myriococcoides]